MNILNELDDGEYEFLIEVLAERMKNVIYMNADTRSREILDDMKNCKELRGNDSIDITYKMHFLINDAFEIIGGLRRNKP